MRILGITIPDEKRVEIGLTELYGIGRSEATRILKDAGVDPALKVKDVSMDDENKIRGIIETLTLEGDLRREIQANVKRLRDIKAYRGVRHSRGLPARGQRTKSNSRTRRGNVRKTMGTGRKVADKK
jgi:small subunit ribosomal protein S13